MISAIVSFVVAISKPNPFVLRISPAVNMAAVRRRSLKRQKRRQQFARTCSYVQGCSQFIKS